jgi:Arc/MetJ-type ribon-helix-helix transcriptional regulator
MSERAPHTPHEKYESSSEQVSDHIKELERKRHEALKESHEKTDAEVQELHTAAHEEAKSTEQMLDETRRGSPTQDKEPTFINHELKEIAYQRLLKRARRHLSPYSRAMSKVIHQPIVDNASEAVAKTIGRPSGIIGGGIVALIGTSVYYYLTKHYGYNYKPFVFLALLVIGFVLGWFTEILFKSIKLFTKK